MQILGNGNKRMRLKGIRVGIELLRSFRGMTRASMAAGARSSWSSWSKSTVHARIDEPFC